MNMHKRLLKEMRRKWFVSLGLSAILLSLIAIIALPNLSSSQLPDTDLVKAKLTTQIDPKLPKATYPCLPEEAAKLDLLGEVYYGAKTYYLVRANFDNNNAYWEPLIAVSNRTCNSLNANPEQQAVSLETLIDENLAIELSKQRYQKVISEIGGKHKLEAELARQSRENPKLLIPRAFYKALEQLDIKIPRNLQPTSKLTPDQFALGLNMH